MKGFGKALINIFSLVLIALCTLLLIVIAFVPSAALAKAGANILLLCIIAGAVIVLIWQIGKIATFVKAHTAATGV